MGAMPVPAANSEKNVPEEDHLRAQLYRLLASVLARPPGADGLAILGGLDGDGTDLGRALGTLARVARATSAHQADREYHALFIGVGRGELVPFGSYYLTGFLNERPLAVLRQDMARLGAVRSESVKEPEDHIAALCEVMAGMIEGTFAEPGDLTAQRQFYNAHIAGWAPRFFEDLEAAKASRLYAPIGMAGRLFMDIEATAFSMVDA
jgi:TorA maturation chaperone TorD